MSKLTKHLEGKGIVFKVGDSEYILRAPMPEERDTAKKIEAVERRFALMTDEKIIELSKLPPPESEIKIYEEVLRQEEEQLRAESDEDEVEDIERRIRFMRAGIKQRSAADTPLDTMVRFKRNRYLARTLLLDSDGKKIDILKCDIDVQDAAFDAADELWGELNNLGFISDQLSKQQ